jgi:hypothetical protein
MTGRQGEAPPRETIRGLTTGRDERFAVAFFRWRG